MAQITQAIIGTIILAFGAWFLCFLCLKYKPHDRQGSIFVGLLGTGVIVTGTVMITLAYAKAGG